MSSILEHMCADVLQQTATQIKFPSTGMDTMPYWNLLPPKRPIKEVLTDIFAKVLEKGWVDSRSIHIFDTLLHMGGVYWFCNNLIKVLGSGVGLGWGEQASSDRRRQLRKRLTGPSVVWSSGFSTPSPVSRASARGPLNAEKIPWTPEAGPRLGSSWGLKGVAGRHCPR